MQREKRVTVQGPIKKQQPDGMSHRGHRPSAAVRACGSSGMPHYPKVKCHVSLKSVSCGPVHSLAHHGHLMAVGLTSHCMRTACKGSKNAYHIPRILVKKMPSLEHEMHQHTIHVKTHCSQLTHCNC